MSKIPNEVIFGINNLGESINYGYVREINDDSELIELLKFRLKVFFIDQVQPLQNSNSAFPLTTMTCVGIETLGEIFIPEKKDDTSFQFVEILRKMHQTFGRNLNKKFEKKLIEIWTEKDISNIDTYGKLLYRFFRNTMIHGYQGKGIFLSYEDTPNIIINEHSGFITMNPNWYWNSFKNFFERIFIETINAQSNNANRINCLKYIRTFLLD